MASGTVQLPEIFVLGGPNGAGKTTAAKVLLPDTLSVAHFVNADFIAQGISPFDPASSALEAGRMMLRRIRDLRDQRATFAFETTLASRTFAPFLREAKSSGYLVYFIYVWVSSPDLAVSRVRHRVAQGGHDVPELTIRRRYWRGLRNFFSLYVPLADSWTICNNSGRGPELIAEGDGDGNRRILDQALYDTITKSIDHAP